MGVIEEFANLFE